MSRRPGRPSKPILDPELVAAKLAELNGNIAATARSFDVQRASLQELIKKRPALQLILADAREGMIDHAESSLYRAVLGGEAWAVCFFLKTQARHRGYIERTIVESETPLASDVRKKLNEVDGERPGLASETRSADAPLVGDASAPEVDKPAPTGDGGEAIG